MKKYVFGIIGYAFLLCGWIIFGIECYSTHTLFPAILFILAVLSFIIQSIIDK